MDVDSLSSSLVYFITLPLVLILCLLCYISSLLAPVESILSPEMQHARFLPEGNERPRMRDDDGFFGYLARGIGSVIKQFFD